MEEADRTWRELVAAFQAGGQRLSVSPGTTLPAIEESKSKRALQLMATANRVQDFYTLYPHHSKIAEARKLEVLVLMQAVREGAPAEDRLVTNVQKFRGDQTLPEEMRSAVAGSYDFWRATRDKTDRAETRQAIEITARNLVKEFPAMPQGYESLLTLAQGADAAQGKMLADEILAGTAPLPVQVGARSLVERLNLIGRLFSDILRDAGAENVPIELQSGKPTLIYSWGMRSPPSVALGEMLARRKMTAVNLVGINLDRDTTAAREVAKAHLFPGTLHYDTLGTSGALASLLKMTGAPFVYFTDADGVIRDVQGTSHLEEKLSRYGL